MIVAFAVEERMVVGSGVNLWDHGFWPVGGRNIFRHHPTFEVLNTRSLRQTHLGFVYFHVKGMKKDRGLGVYQLAKNPNSIFNIRKYDPRWTHPELMTFEEY